jgi:hypothetical protein
MFRHHELRHHELRRHDVTSDPADTDGTETDAPVGYQAVEFLDIPPMDEALTEPPSPGATHGVPMHVWHMVHETT